LYFLFQAEDGIRDFHVTGVQTCALPISRTGASYAEALAEAQRLGYAEADPTEDVTGKDAAAKMAILARLAFGTPVHLDEVPHERSEERRVGKGCRSRRTSWLHKKISKRL